jgi:hypothetical protein
MELTVRKKPMDVETAEKGFPVTLTLGGKA